MGAFTGAMGGNAAAAPAQNNSSFGAVLNSAFDANQNQLLHQLQIKNPLQP
jgi:hypothetical protein